MILPGYMPALQMCLVVGLHTSSLQIADVFGFSFAPVYMHLFGLLRIETSSNTKSALWDASLCVCFSVFVYFMFGKLPMFTVVALSDSYDYPPSAYRLKGDGDDEDYDYAPAALEIDGDDDDEDYDYALAA
uniref:Uncharacterized protein n=1 Tax=Tanacetum cinerariifolium TaxID=118510 RepID=A0A699GJN6_TANCI|nr:hypothetical protein [Tanacetum cinerariifolium]